MRALSADDTGLFTAVGGRATYLRVDVQDSGGTWQDLTSYAGQNMVMSATWRDSTDGEGQNGEIVLKREVEQLSLAPLMQGSPLNLAFAYPGTYAALLQVKRGARIYTADVPADAPPSSIASGTWRLMFDGKIDSVDSATDENVTLAVSDAQGNLRDLFIESERVYAYAQGPFATKGCRIWTPLMTSVAGDLLIPTDANRNDHFYQAQNASGVSVASPEPTYVIGGTVADNTQSWSDAGSTSTTAGTAVETVIQQIIADNGGGSITLQLPGGSPGWLIKWYLQQRQSVWDAIRALTDQIGWDCRYKFDAGSSTFKLTLWTPDRSKSTPDYTFAKSDKIEVTQLKVDVAEVRNAVQVVFSASGSSDPSGNPLRVSILVTDATSIAKYGRRFMEMGEASTSNVDTSTEATAMATAAVNDLKEPSAEKVVTLPYFPFTELGDLYRFSADGVYHDGNLDLAVIGYEHTVSDGDVSTKLTCRGKPSIGTSRWLARGAELNADDIHQLAVTDHHKVTLAAQSVVGGTLLTANGTANKRVLGQDFEWHVSKTPGFTPDSTTLVQSQGGNQVTAPHLLPGGAYVAKIVPVRRNATRIVRGMPSADFAFTAGRAAAGHLQDGIALGSYPLNGGFETRLDGSGMPDWWTVYSGTLGTHLSVIEDANGLSGNRYMRLGVSGGVYGGIKSAFFPIVNEANESSRSGQLYYVTWWRKAGTSNSTGATYSVLINLCDINGSQVDLLTMASGKPADDKKTHWVKEELYVPIHAGDPTARMAQLIIIGTAGATFQLDLDEYRIQSVGTDWYSVGAFGGASPGFTDNYEAIPNFLNSWATFSAGSTSVAFRKAADGRVYLKGTCSGGAALSQIFTLPVGYRPSKTHVFDSPDGVGGLVGITSAGAVNHNAGTNAQVRMDPISFMTYP